mmetsp:Transcript_3831/g.15471  ORF Transcript_3831/g.15471 Transcript_3831/m.15471 type:complete len:201 (-) Transcript_3831:421-1023(-)
MELGRVDGRPEVGVLIDGLDVAGGVDVGGQRQHLLGLGHLLAHLAHGPRHGADVDAPQHLLVLRVEFLREVVHQAHVKVLAAQRLVPLDGARDELADALLGRALAGGVRVELVQRGPGVGGAHVVEHHVGRLLELLIDAVLERRGARLVEQGEHVHARDLSGVEQRHAVLLAEEWRHREHGVANFGLGVLLGEVEDIVEH